MIVLIDATLETLFGTVAATARPADTTVNEQPRRRTRERFISTTPIQFRASGRVHEGSAPSGMLLR